MIIINGAGIAGLCLANALLQRNMEFVLIEKSAKFEAIGAGILLQNNGLAILEQLSLLDVIQGFDVTQMSLGNFKHIKTVDTQSTGMKCKVVHRKDLQQTLLKNIDAHLIKMDSSITHFEQDDKQVSIYLDSGEKILGDYLIDASGIHSQLEQKSQLHDSGLWCWRSIINLTKPIKSSGEFWFGKHRLGFAPINSQQAYVYHVIKLDYKKNRKQHENHEDFPQANREQWIKQQSSIIKDIDYFDFTNANWLSHPLKDKTINWGLNRLIRIGDSAHAMTPNLGQGAVLSMEDAICLADILHRKNSKSLSKPDVLQELIQKRHKRVERMHRLSRYFGDIAHNDLLIMNTLKSIAILMMPLKHSIKQQVHWMNKFVHQLHKMKI